MAKIYGHLNKDKFSFWSFLINLSFLQNFLGNYVCAVCSGTILEFFQYIQLTVLLDELEDDDDMCIKFSQIEGFVVFNDKSMHGT